MNDQAAVLEKILRERRTVHDFLDTPVPAAPVLKALDAARFAPNHHLSEPWRYYLLGPETALAISELNAQLVAKTKGSAAALAKRERWRRIPGWVAITQVLDPDPLRLREDYAASCCAVYAAMLGLWAQGIASKWTTGPVTRDPRFYDLLWIDPEQEELVALLWYGFPERLPETRRKPLEQVLVRLP